MAGRMQDEAIKAQRLRRGGRGKGAAHAHASAAAPIETSTGLA